MDKATIERHLKICTDLMIQQRQARIEKQEKQQRQAQIEKQEGILAKISQALDIWAEE